MATGEYERLIRPIEDRMMRTVWHLIRDPDDADDAFQAALAKVWTCRRKISRHANPHALILRICVNSAYDVLRHKARRRRVEALKAIPAMQADTAPQPADRLIAAENHALVLNAIADLPRNQAAAVTLRCMDGLPYHDIGLALGCSEATARTHVARGREKLGEMFPHLAQRGMKEVTA